MDEASTKAMRRMAAVNLALSEQLLELGSAVEQAVEQFRQCVAALTKVNSRLKNK